MVKATLDCVIQVLSEMWSWLVTDCLGGHSPEKKTPSSPEEMEYGHPWFLVAFQFLVSSLDLGILPALRVCELALPKKVFLSF